MANNSTSSSKLNLPGTVGSRTVSLHTERVVKVFAIQESELETLSYLNTAATLCFSLGSFFLNEVWSHSKIQGYQWALDKELLAVIAFYLFATVAIFFRRGTIGRIKRDSIAINQEMSRRKPDKGKNQKVK